MLRIISTSGRSALPSPRDWWTRSTSDQRSVLGIFEHCARRSESQTTFARFSAELKLRLLGRLTTSAGRFKPITIAKEAMGEPYLDVAEDWRHRPNSTSLIAKVERAGGPAFLKISHDRARLHSERSYLSDPSRVVETPALLSSCLDGRDPWILTSWIEGTTLDKELTAHTLSTVDIADLVQSIAATPHLDLHRGTPLRDHPRYGLRLKRRLAELDALVPDFFRHELVDAVRKIAKDLDRRVGNLRSERHVARLPGDAHLGNVLRSESGSLVFVDASADAHLEPSYDLGKIAQSLFTSYHTLFDPGDGVCIRATYRHDLQNAFASSLSSTPAMLERAVVAACFHLMSLLPHHLHHLKTPSGRDDYMQLLAETRELVSHV